MQNAMHHPMNVDEVLVEAMKRNIAFTNKQLEFLSSDFVGFGWKNHELKTWSQVFVNFMCTLFKNLTRTPLLPQFSWGFERHGASQIPIFRFLGQDFVRGQA